MHHRFNQFDGVAENLKHDRSNQDYHGRIQKSNNPMHHQTYHGRQRHQHDPVGGKATSKQTHQYHHDGLEFRNYGAIPDFVVLCVLVS